MTRDTVGKISTNLLSKTHDNTHSAHEQMLEQLMSYDVNLYECAEYGKKLYNTDFFIVVTTKKERLMQNVLRNYFIPRRSCPTPEYDQTVYRYNWHDDVIEFLWVIPSKDTCVHLRDNALLLPAEEKKLIEFVISFYDGSLLQLAKKLNNEMPDSPLLRE